MGPEPVAPTDHPTTDARAPSGADRCPSCGSAALQQAGFAGVVRRVCARCGSCWDVGGADPGLVDSIACPGCPSRGVCESRPTALTASMTHHHTLEDGTAVLVRPLLYSDRLELAAAFQELSPAARRMRFLHPPDHLDERDLEYLTNLDYFDHFALAAFAEDEPGRPGIAVARYIRDPEDAGTAEVAVTVLDAYQRRGLGTLLLIALADLAVERGVRTFVSYVRWDNVNAVVGLTDFGARIRPDEPGVARVEIDLPTTISDLDDRFARRILTAFAHQVRGAVAWIPVVAGPLQRPRRA